jgi:hypothetical protein
MKNRSYGFIILCCMLASGIYFAYNYNWIIFQYPSKTGHRIASTCSTNASKRTIKRIFWNHGKWHHESADIIWSENKAETIQHLINSWLTLLDEEKIMTKKVSVQSVIISSSGAEAYISFDRNPFDKRSSTYHKSMWIEGLLKTLRDNSIKVQTIQCLVHHQPMHDVHLDFESPWPLEGFLEIQKKK